MRHWERDLRGLHCPLWRNFRLTHALAVLQPPFFDRDADDAVNFGAMGAVVGHESALRCASRRAR